MQHFKTPLFLSQFSLQCNLHMKETQNQRTRSSRMPVCAMQQCFTQILYPLILASIFYYIGIKIFLQHTIKRRFKAVHKCISASKRFLTAIYPTSYILIVILFTLHFILYTDAYFILVIHTVSSSFNFSKTCLQRHCNLGTSTI